MIKQCLTTLLTVLLVYLASFSSTVIAKKKVPDEVQDLRYGVILYHFFQQSYFDALTESLVGEQVLDLPNHQQSAKLLRGGMSLSYGMGQDAEEIFTELLDTLKQPEQRDRAWFYLAKLYYMRGDKLDAKAVLDNISEDLPQSLLEEYLYMTANIALQQGDTELAESTIDSLPKASPWRAYYLFNRGSRQTLAGYWRQGVDSFQQVNRIKLRDEEGRTLQDRSHTATGFAYLSGGENALAIQSFKSVRLESPLVDRAMLGYGWAAAQQQDFMAALSPWQALSKRSVMDASVQESLLAIPYAYEKLDARASALQEYQRAIGIFEQELGRLNDAVDVFNEMPLVQVVADEDGLSSDWIMGKDYLPINDQAPYLSHLISKQKFQSAVKALNDLITMGEYLSQAEIRLSALQGVLDFQQQVWQDNLGESQRDEYRQRYEDLIVLKNRLVQQQRIAEQRGDGEYYLSEDELELWEMADNAEDLITLLQQNDYDLTEEKQLLELYQGLLKWQVSEKESERSWQFEKQLREVNEALKETKQRVEAIESLDDDRYNEKFSSQVVALQERLASQRSELQLAMQQSEDNIRLLAINELYTQQQRLTFYLAQAKLAVARLYDIGNKESVSDE